MMIDMSKYQSNIPNKTTRIAVSRVESTGTIDTCGHNGPEIPFLGFSVLQIELESPVGFS